MTAPRVRPGQLRHRITFEQNTATGPTAEGDDIPTWTTLATVWAQATPLSGTERIASQRERATLQMQFEIRYLAALTPAMRVSWSGRLFDILQVLNLAERNVKMRVIAEEQAA